MNQLEEGSSGWSWQVGPKETKRRILNMKMKEDMQMVGGTEEMQKPQSVLECLCEFRYELWCDCFPVNVHHDVPDVS